MFTSNNGIVPNKVRIGWHFLSNKYAYRDAYSALKSSLKVWQSFCMHMLFDFLLCEPYFSAL